MPLTAPPDPPSIDDPENFATKAQAFTQWMVTFRNELDTIIGQTIPAGSAAAGTLTGTTIAANVTASSLTSLGIQAADLKFLDGTYDIGKSGATRPRDLFLTRLLDISASGAGQIKFPATQNPSTDANTFDDYEEGTFTIQVIFDGAAVGITYAAQTGRYTKLGNRAFASGFVALSNKGSSTGSARIIGSPFVCKDDDSAYSPPALRTSSITFADMIQGFMVKNTTQISLTESTNAGLVTDITNADFSNGSQIMYAISHEVA